MKTQIHRTALLLAGLLAGTATLAATITWDGGGDGVNWSDGANWTGTPDDTAPGTADTAQFADSAANVSSTVDAGFASAVQFVEMNQATDTATNSVSLGNSISISANNGATSGLQYGATVVDPRIIRWTLNGNTLSFTSSSVSTPVHNLYGTYLFNATGSRIRSTRVTGTGSGDYPTFNIGDGANVAVVDATAAAEIGQITDVTTTTTDSSRTALINIGSGSAVHVSSGARLDFRKRMRSGSNGRTALKVSNSGTIDIAAGGTNGVVFSQVNANNISANIEMINLASGVVDHGGSVLMSLDQRGTAAINNAGTWKAASGAKLNGIVTGTGSGDYGTVVLSNQADGVLRNAAGSGSLDYDPLTSATYLNQTLRLTNAGTIAPGAGTGGSGTSSVGTFTLTDIDVTNTVTGVVSIDLGGPGAGAFDKLVLSNGTLDLTAAGDTLQLAFVNGYTPSSGTSWTILEYGAVALGAGGVGFDSIEIVNGSGVAADPGSYTITYGGTSAQLKFALPGTLIMLR